LFLDLFPGLFLGLFLPGIRGGKFELGAGKTNRKSFAMETLYDLLGALPNDDADHLRAAFRRAAKRAHPDVNPTDPDAGHKFRRVMRANEILCDAEQRAAYDRLLELAHREQEQAAKRAAADKLHKLASAVMALAGISVVALSGYAMFIYLSANVPLATTTAETGRESAAVIAANPDEEATASAPAATPDTSRHIDSSTTVPAAKSAPNDAAETTPGRAASSPERTAKHSPRYAPAYIDGGIIFYRLRDFAHVFAALAQPERYPRAGRTTASSPSTAATTNANGNRKSSRWSWRHRRKPPLAAPSG
jgi:curved DNA-binding protein CbpA